MLRQWLLKPLLLVIMTCALLAAGYNSPVVLAGDVLADQGTASGWYAQYYANAHLSGIPSHVRVDSAIDFNWASGRPVAEVGEDYFSARWTADFYFEAGRYRFSTMTDDGVRLFVDDALLIDEWRQMAATQHDAEVQLAAGVYTVRMEYFEQTGGAVARLWWSRVDAPTSTWRAEYFANTTLSGAPVAIRDEPSLNFDWGWGSPVPDVVGADYFSARWSRTLSLTPGTYRFLATCDDGMRIWVDGGLLVDEWYEHPAETHTAEMYLDGNPHRITVEYFEKQGTATARLTWAATPSASNHWQGEYYNNRWLSGSPTLVRNDSTIDFDWGTGSPDYRVASDNFSVRWTRSVHFDAGNYEFRARSDDGMRLYVDGQLLINEWYQTAPKSFAREVRLSEGVHTVRVEYFEQSGGATARVAWEGPLARVTVGNIVTCAGPYGSYSWVKVYQLRPDGSWLDINPQGYGSIESSGWLKVTGLPVDYARYGDVGHPYRVEQWLDGQLVRSVGDTQRGEAPFRVVANQDSFTPWQCTSR